MKRRDVLSLLATGAAAWPLMARAQLPTSLPQVGVAAVTPLHLGWYDLVPDVSLNFQLNRWASYGGPDWLADVRPVLVSLTTYNSWRSTFVQLGETALAQGRKLHAALHFRCAEFFMLESDPRKEPLRKRLIGLFIETSGVAPSARREVAFDGLRLPTWSFPAPRPRGTMVIFGGFDSYIEEFFPILAILQQKGFNVVAFEGPGQGAVIEEQKAPMIPDWHRPGAAVLDAFNLDDVTLIGISLGGCLAIRAAAHEPRVRRVVAFDVLSDFFECMMRSAPGAGESVIRGLLFTGADALLDRLIGRLSRGNPVAEWGIAQACHVFGSERPSQAFRAAQTYHTRDVSGNVGQDVLLLAGSQDHYVPLPQLWDQIRLLSNARSITSRVFSREEQAQAHCQVGNMPLAVDTICDWTLKIAAA
jgi:alpha-beta hydrolase superfamily lysophospholipase